MIAHPGGSSLPAIEHPHLMKNYNRAPINFVRGEGVWLIDANGERYLDLVAGIAVCALGHSHPRDRGRDSGTSRDARALQQSLSSRTCGRARQQTGRDLRFRSGFLLQLGNRSERSRDQARTQTCVPPGANRPQRHRRMYEFVPRPHYRCARGDRQSKISRRLRSASRRFHVHAVQRRRLRSKR